MSMPAAQHAGAAERQHISIKMNKASAAGAVLPPPAGIHQKCHAFVRQCGRVALFVFCISCSPLKCGGARCNSK